MFKPLILAALAGIAALVFWWLSPVSPIARGPSLSEYRSFPVASAGTAARGLASGSAASDSVAEAKPPVSLMVLALAGPVAGRALETAAPVVRTSSEKGAGRIAPVDPEALVQLDRLEAGSGVKIALPDGSQRAGTVNLATRDRDGWMRVGGSLDDGGSFSFSHRDGESAGLIQVPAERRAWQLQRIGEGALSLIERRLDELICLSLPPPEPGYLEVVDEESDEAAPPLLSSRPNANHVLYLDFDGEVVTDINWNDGRTIKARKARLG